MKRRDHYQTKHRLNTLLLGRANDLLYSASSSQGTGFTNWSKEQCLARYNEGMASRGTTPISAYKPSSFVDVISSWSGRDKVMNNCDHTKQRIVNLPYFLVYWKYDSLASNPYRTEYMLPYRRQPIYSTVWADAASAALQFSSFNDQGFSARAYWSMRPKLESSVSLINSIFELKDFKDVAQFMFSPKGAARSIVQSMKGLSSLNRAIGGGNSHKFRSPSNAIRKAYTALHDYVQSASASTHVDNLISSTTKATAVATLTANLAVLPTIRDVIAIHGEMQKDVYAQLRSFKQMGDEGARSHYSEHEDISSNITVGSYNNYVNATGKRIHLERTATMVSKYQILWKRFEDMYPKWWGLELGADEVWNMLPLSFVLDYGMTIGKSLQYMDVDKRINVLGHEYCESVKVTAELGYYIAQSYRTPHLIINGAYQVPSSKVKYLLVSGTRGVSYKRLVMEPYKGPALPQLRRPSTVQAANMLALARCLLF